MSTGSRLKDKIAIVTGSTSGIGVGIARVFAQEGATVVICGRREEKGQSIAKQLEAQGGAVSYHHLDITKPESMQALIEDTVGTYGRLDVLVNNAAKSLLRTERLMN